MPKHNDVFVGVLVSDDDGKLERKRRRKSGIILILAMKEFPRGSRASPISCARAPALCLVVTVGPEEGDPEKQDVLCQLHALQQHGCHSHTYTLRLSDKSIENLLNRGRAEAE